MPEIRNWELAGENKFYRTLEIVTAVRPEEQRELVASVNADHPQAKIWANLITAAPQLLDALQAAQEEIRLIRMKDCNVVYNPALQLMMSAAIRKAQGGAA